MVYPSAPWTLKGYALQTLHLIDIARVRPLVPSELELISVWPGKTLGGVYLASYKSGSVMEYNELIVVAGLANFSGKVGAWVSHIYVDNPDSVAGGREIWGLPKEMAEFTWEKGNDRSRVLVQQGDRSLCSFSYDQQSLAWRSQLGGPVLSSLGSDLLLFKGEFESEIGPIGSKLEIPLESPFASLGLGQPWLTFYCNQLHLVVGAPKVVGERVTTFSRNAGSA